MRILLDVCIASRTLVRCLQSAGHDVSTAISLNPTAEDADLLQRALHDDRILITQDKDFGALSNLRRLPHGPIVRVVGPTVHDQVEAVESLLASHATELTGRVLVTVSSRRIRIRR